MHRISKAKFGAADIYSGGAGHDSFTWVQQHENGTGPMIASSVFSSYTPALSIGDNH
jgi:calmodulin-binding transcription activator